MSRTFVHTPVTYAFPEHYARDEKPQNSRRDYLKLMSSTLKNGVIVRGLEVLGTLTANIQPMKDIHVITGDINVVPSRYGKNIPVYYPFIYYEDPDETTLMSVGRKISDTKINLDKKIDVNVRQLLEVSIRNEMNSIRTDTDVSPYRYYYSWRTNDDNVTYINFVNKRLLTSHINLTTSIDDNDYHLIMIPVNIHHSRHGFKVTQDNIEYGSVTYLIIRNHNVKPAFNRYDYLMSRLHDSYPSDNGHEWEKINKHFNDHHDSYEWDWEHRYNRKRAAVKQELNTKVSNITDLTIDDLYDIFGD